MELWSNSGQTDGVRLSLKHAYPELFHIARNKEALVKEHFQYQNEVVSWVLNYNRPIQDWEEESIWICSIRAKSSPSGGIFLCESSGESQCDWHGFLL